MVDEVGTIEVVLLFHDFTDVDRRGGVELAVVDEADDDVGAGAGTGGGTELAEDLTDFCSSTTGKVAWLETCSSEATESASVACFESVREASALSSEY